MFNFLTTSVEISNKVLNIIYNAHHRKCWQEMINELAENYAYIHIQQYTIYR